MYVDQRGFGGYVLCLLPGASEHHYGQMGRHLAKRRREAGSYDSPNDGARLSAGPNDFVFGGLDKKVGAASGATKRALIAGAPWDPKSNACWWPKLSIPS